MMRRAGLATALLAILLTGAGAARAADGAALFATHCVACHQAGGVGTPGLAPALAGDLGRRAALPAGRDYLVQVMLAGLNGPIQSDGQAYNGFMPSFARLSDAELAALLNHVVLELNAQALPAGYQPLGAAEVAAARNKQLGAGAVHSLRARSEAEGSRAP
jgi:mono/diheme cytochrome c family protein